MWRIVYFFQDWLPELWRFIKHIPGYYRLETKLQGYEPEAYSFIIKQYEKVLMHITNGRMSKPTYFADSIISLMNDVYCEDWGEMCA